MANDGYILRIIAPEHEFVRPYIAHYLPEAVLADADDEADRTLVVCSPAESRVYADRFPDATILVCPVVIGTGMTGFGRRLAEMVYRGTFVHVAGRDVPVSIVHAVDLGRAAAVTADMAGVFEIADTARHDIDELADALAYRMGDKRILTVSQRWGRWLVRRSFREAVGTLPIVDGTAFAESFGFVPTNVTKYLRTHVYDESSL